MIISWLGRFCISISIHKYLPYNITFEMKNISPFCVLFEVKTHHWSITSLILDMTGNNYNYVWSKINLDVPCWYADLIACPSTLSFKNKLYDTVKKIQTKEITAINNIPFHFKQNDLRQFYFIEINLFFNERAHSISTFKK